MPRKKSKVETGLKAKGFEQSEGDHHFFVYVTTEGKKTAIRTKTSHTPKMKEIPDNLLGQMAKQCKLNKQGFLNLIDCPLSREKYEASLSNLIKTKEDGLDNKSQSPKDINTKTETKSRKKRKRKDKES